MTLMVLIGVVFGVGLWLLKSAVAPARIDLAVELGRWEVARRHASRTKTTRTGLRDRMGQWMGDEFAKRGIEFPKLHTDLAITGKTLEEHIASMIVSAIIALFVPGILATLALAMGVAVPVPVPIVFGILFAAVVVVVGNGQIRDEAEGKRDELRRALGTYLDLVSMSLAGGRGVPEALPTSAAIGTGWAFDLLADTITRARRTGDTPWAALGELGHRVGLQELVDLSSALTLVGDNGAKVRDSLGARANTLRRRQLADAEGEAMKADDSMRIAQIVLGMGFFLLISYPAVVNVLAT